MVNVSCTGELAESESLRGEKRQGIFHHRRSAGAICSGWGRAGGGRPGKVAAFIEHNRMCCCFPQRWEQTPDKEQLKEGVVYSDPQLKGQSIVSGTLGGRVALGSHGRSMRLLALICVSQKQKKEDAGSWINFSFPSFYSPKALNPWTMGTNFKSSLLR